MEFALFMHPTYWAESDGSLDQYMGRLVEYAVLAEESSFDSVWTSEHHFGPLGGVVSSPPVMLAALSQATRRVRLGTSVVLMPLHHPIEIAEQLAMVDLLSRGRLEFGAGRGNEVEGYGIFYSSIEEAEVRQREGVDVILEAWTHQRFSYEGELYQFHGIEVWPRPMQQPHPPVWIAATSNPRSFEQAARRGFNLMTVAHVRPLDELASLTRRYRDTWQEAGRDPSSYRLLTHFLCIIADDRKQGRALAREYVQNYRSLGQSRRPRPDSDLPIAAWGNPDPATIDYLIDEGRVIAGDPDDCVRMLRQAHELLGTNVPGLTFYLGGIPDEHVRRSFRLFKEEVEPRLRGVGSIAATGSRVG